MVNVSIMLRYSCCMDGGVFVQWYECVCVTVVVLPLLGEWCCMKVVVFMLQCKYCCNNFCCTKYCCANVGVLVLLY